MKRSASEFGFIFFDASTDVSDFRVVFMKLMINLNAPFCFYSGDYFDRVVVPFKSRICVWMFFFLE